MNVGSVFGSASPAFGVASGRGLFGSSVFQNILGTLSPAYGMASGHGLFGKMREVMFGNHNPNDQQAPAQQAPVQTAGPAGFNPAADSNLSDPYLHNMFMQLMMGTPRNGPAKY